MTLAKRAETLQAIGGGGGAGNSEGECGRGGSVYCATSSLCPIALAVAAQQQFHWPHKLCRAKRPAELPPPKWHPQNLRPFNGLHSLTPCAPPSPPFSQSSVEKKQNKTRVKKRQNINSSSRLKEATRGQAHTSTSVSRWNRRKSKAKAKAKTLAMAKVVGDLLPVKWIS